MNPIQVTEIDGTKITLNLDLIESIRPAKEKTKIVTNKGTTFLVTEKYETIRKKVKNESSIG